MTRRRPPAFYALATVFGLFVLFLYGPMLTILVLSFQGPIQLFDCALSVFLLEHTLSQGVPSLNIHRIDLESVDEFFLGPLDATLPVHHLR